MIQGDKKAAVENFEGSDAMLMEGSAVAEYLGSAFWFGASATKSQVLQLRSPRIWHVVTHGFCLPYEAAPLERRPEGESRFEGLRRSRSPLLRSGVALAGANAHLRGDPLTEEADNGLLLSADLHAMDLGGTAMAVMSVCRGGAGEASDGEGVWGLRRALMLAGVRTVVACLWNVYDDAGLLLMDRFYQNLTERQLPRAEALREAQVCLRCLTQEQYQSYEDTGELPKELAVEPKPGCARPGPFAAPVHWAGWIVQGDGGPLPEVGADVTAGPTGVDTEAGQSP